MTHPSSLRTEGSARPGGRVGRCPAMPAGRDRWRGERMKGKTWRSGPMLLGYGLTALVLGGFACLALQEVCVQQAEHVQICQSRWEGLLDAPFNEVGDTLAGFAGTLAFVWLIVTVLIQGMELAAQREELMLARKESARMAGALEAQAEVFRDEQRQRAEDRAERELDARLDNIVVFAKEVSLDSRLFKYIFDFVSKFGTVEAPVQDVTPYDGLSSSSEFIYQMYDRICVQSDEIGSLAERLMKDEDPDCDPELLFLFQEKLSEVAAMNGRLSPAQQTRLDSLRIEGIIDQINFVANQLVQLGLMPERSETPQ